MITVVLFLPAIISLIAVIIAFRFGVCKNGLIVAAVATMVTFLLVKEMVMPKAINFTACSFALAYVLVSLLSSKKTE